MSVAEMGETVLVKNQMPLFYLQNRTGLLREFISVN